MSVVSVIATASVALVLAGGASAATVGKASAQSYLGEPLVVNCNQRPPPTQLGSDAVSNVSDNYCNVEDVMSFADACYEPGTDVADARLLELIDGTGVFERRMMELFGYQTLEMFANELGCARTPPRSFAFGSNGGGVARKALKPGRTLTSFGFGSGVRGPISTEPSNRTELIDTVEPDGTLSAVPLPGAVWLLLVGLGGLMALRKRGSL